MLPRTTWVAVQLLFLGCLVRAPGVRAQLLQVALDGADFEQDVVLPPPQQPQQPPPLLICPTTPSPPMRVMLVGALSDQGFAARAAVDYARWLPRLCDGLFEVTYVSRDDDGPLRLGVSVLRTGRDGAEAVISAMYDADVLIWVDQEPTDDVKRAATHARLPRLVRVSNGAVQDTIEVILSSELGSREADTVIKPTLGCYGADDSFLLQPASNNKRLLIAAVLDFVPENSPGGSAGGIGLFVRAAADLLARCAVPPRLLLVGRGLAADLDPLLLGSVELLSDLPEEVRIDVVVDPRATGDGSLPVAVLDLMARQGSLLVTSSRGDFVLPGETAVVFDTAEELTEALWAVVAKPDDYVAVAAAGRRRVLADYYSDGGQESRSAQQFAAFLLSSRVDSMSWLVRRAAALSCTAAEKSSRELGDPGGRLKAGDHGGAACSLARQMMERWSTYPFWPEHLRGLATLLLAHARELDRKQEFLWVAARIAEIASLQKEGDEELLLIAARARLLRGGTPVIAARRFAERLELRRGQGSFTSDPVVLEAMDGTLVSLSLAVEARENATEALCLSPAKLRHDALQLRYLASLGKELAAPTRELLQKSLRDINSDDSALLTRLADAYVETARLASVELARICDKGAECDILHRLNIAWLAHQKKSHHIDAVVATVGKVLHLSIEAAPPGSMLISDGWSTARVKAEFDEEDYSVIDGFFTEKALRSLHKQLVESTVWFVQKRAHWGAMLEDGLASPLLLKAVEELRNRLPIGDAELTQAWAYRFSYNGSTGIRKHADQGLISVNCWLDCVEGGNLDPESGGLDLYLATDVQSLDFQRANEDFRAVENATRHARALSIPHRDNRCIVFKSKLVHETQPLNFKSDFQCSRTNLVFMFGSVDWWSSR